MSAIAKPAFVGARGIDSVELVSTPDAARRVHEAQTDFVLQYLGSVTPAIVSNILDAGLAFMPVTYADKFDPPSVVAELAALELAKGTTTWLDVEGISSMDPIALQLKINAWAAAVISAGFEPGMYVGPGCPLTSLELYRLKVVRYWHCGAKIIDRNGQIAEPACGWCMYQLFPSVTWGGIWSDVDVVQQDFRGRLPTWTMKQ